MNNIFVNNIDGLELIWWYCYRIGIRWQPQTNLLKQKLHIVNNIACQRMNSSICYCSLCSIFLNRFLKISKGLLRCLCKSFCQTHCSFSYFSASFAFKKCFNLQIVRWKSWYITPSEYALCFTYKTTIQTYSASWTSNISLNPQDLWNQCTREIAARFMILYVRSHTSECSSCIISYMSKSTNNFSGDLLLLAIASPKLSSIETLFVVTSAKHCSLSESKPSNIWSQTFLSPANNNLTCSCIIIYLNEI